MQLLAVLVGGLDYVLLIRTQPATRQAYYGFGAPSRRSPLEGATDYP